MIKESTRQGNSISVFLFFFINSQITRAVLNPRDISN
jgi:hypothetical protein